MDRDRILAAIPHVMAFVPIPLLNIVLAFLYRMFAGPISPFIDSHARENINFQISYQLYSFGLFILAILVAQGSSAFSTGEEFSAGGALLLIGSSFLSMALLVVVGILWILFLIVAIIKALTFKEYKFPLAIRFLK